MWRGTKNVMNKTSERVKFQNLNSDWRTGYFFYPNCVCVCVCGCVWLCVVVCGCVWLCVVVCVCVWLCVSCARIFCLGFKIEQAENCSWLSSCVLYCTFLVSRYLHFVWMWLHRFNTGNWATPGLWSYQQT